MTSLTSVRLNSKPNQYLVLPSGFGVETPHQISPVYQLNTAALFDVVRQIILSEPRVTLLTISEQYHRIDVVQRTRIFRFVDDISIEIIPLGRHAGLAIYSRSRVGFSDLGVNGKRVRRWLSRIECAAVAKMT